MARRKFPSDEVYRLMLRLPEEMRALLTDAAQASGRSINAEVIHRLERSFEEADEVPPAMVSKIAEEAVSIAIKAFEKRLETIYGKQRR